MPCFEWCEKLGCAPNGKNGIEKWLELEEYDRQRQGKANEGAWERRSGNDAIQQSLEGIDVVKEPGEADAAWPEGGVGGERECVRVRVVVWYEGKVDVVFVAKLESRFQKIG